MKVTIVTIIDNQNIGTYLQAYALATVVKSFGHDVRILNYHRKRSELLSLIKKIIKKKRTNPIFALISISYRVTTVSISRRRLHKFLRKHFVLSKKYNINDLYKGIEQDSDIYIVGSDQVWNSGYNEGVDKIFFLDFVKTKAKKITYAASIGKNELGGYEKKEIKKLLYSFNDISVRELQAVEILDNLGFKNVLHVLDPTLLLNKKEWTSLINQNTFIKKEPYLLIYSVETANKTIIDSLAKKIALKYNLKIYVVTTDWFRGKIPCDKIFYFTSPEKFISLFNNADFTIVSSFHGTLFSLIFEKEFLSVAPEKYNSRIKSLLEQLNLKERIISEKMAIDDINFSKINYDAVMKKIAVSKEISFNFLNKWLKEKKELPMQLQNIFIHKCQKKRLSE